MRGKFNIEGVDFAIDDDYAIYKEYKGARTFYLTNKECELIVRAGVSNIVSFLNDSKANDTTTIKGLAITNCNP